MRFAAEPVTEGIIADDFFDYMLVTNTSESTSVTLQEADATYTDFAGFFTDWVWPNEDAGMVAGDDFTLEFFLSSGEQVGPTLISGITSGTIETISSSVTSGSIV